MTTPFLHTPSAWKHTCHAIRTDPDALADLAEAADAARGITRLTVIDKRLPVPSGDPHDYVSQGPYWWPDPSKPDGLPYIRRDGETNPEFDLGDRTPLEAMHKAVMTLVLHAGATGDVASAVHARRLLRQWFLDPDTRMNPNLRFGQRIPGICDGRGIGIIDTASLCFVLDAAARLPVGHASDETDGRGLRQWVADYLDWVLESDHGRDECRQHNNHGTWYDTQVVCFALVCGRRDVAIRQLETHTYARLEAHLAADGRQPHELARTRALSYSTFNLLGFACLAQAGRALGIDLWRRSNAVGTGIADAVRWLLPYYLGERPWTWPQIVPFETRHAVLLLALAAQGTGDAVFDGAAARLARHPWERVCFCAPVTGSRRGSPAAT